MFSSFNAFLMVVMLSEESFESRLGSLTFILMIGVLPGLKRSPNEMPSAWVILPFEIIVLEATVWQGDKEWKKQQ